MRERGSAGREGHIQLHWRTFTEALRQWVESTQALVWTDYWSNLGRAVREWRGRP